MFVRMRVVVSLLSWLYLIVSLIVMWVVLVPIWLLLLPFDPTRRFTHAYACAWASQFMAVAQLWKVRIEHQERLPRRDAAVLVANHQSSVDIMVLFALNRPFRWVAKASLFSIPFLGWTMWMARYVPIRRGDAKSRQQMMKRCYDLLEQNTPIAIFPEGTRSTKATMRPFKRGAFIIACEAKVPVVPIVIHGTRNALPRNALVMASQQVCRPLVHVMEPVDPQLFNYEPKALMAEVRRRMEECRADLRARSDSEASMTSA